VRCGISIQPMTAVGHVWTAPAVQEESDVSAKRSGAVMYPLFSLGGLPPSRCSRHGRWP
jgi:hypothetical protein